MKKGNYYNISKIKDKKFSVIENYTNQTIKTFNNFGDATKLYKSLEKGRGFMGNTPPFFLLPIKTKL